MRTVRYFIRETLVSEAQLLAQFGKKGVDISKDTRLAKGVSDMISGAGKAFDRFSDITRIFKSSSKSSGGVISGILAVARSAPFAGSLFLVPAGVAIAGIAGYEIYKYMTGNTELPAGKESEAAKQGADELLQFHEALRLILVNYNDDIIDKVRLADVKAATETSDKEALITATKTHYDKLAQNICDTEDYNTFFQKQPQYSGVKPKIDSLVLTESGKAQSGQTENMKQKLLQWATMVLIVNYVSDVYRFAADADSAKLEKIGATDEQISNLTASFELNASKIDSDSQYQTSKRAIQSLY